MAMYPNLIPSSALFLMYSFLNI